MDQLAIFFDRRLIRKWSKVNESWSSKIAVSADKNFWKAGKWNFIDQGGLWDEHLKVNLTRKMTPNSNPARSSQI